MLRLNSLLSSPPLFFCLKDSTSSCASCLFWLFISVLLHLHARYTQMTDLFRQPHLTLPHLTSPPLHSRHLTSLPLTISCLLSPSLFNSLFIFLFIFLCIFVHIPGCGVQDPSIWSRLYVSVQKGRLIQWPTESVKKWLVAWRYTETWICTYAH